MSRPPPAGAGRRIESTGQAHFPLPDPSVPPFELLIEADAILTRSGIVYALGGSGLLLALGLVERVGDWDLTTDAPLARVIEACAGVETEPAGPGGVHADHKLRLFEGTVEVIVGMAIRAPSGVCRVPTVVGGRWRGIPTGSPEAWAVAYALLGRPARARTVFAHLRNVGADRETIDILLAEPLPAGLAARLAKLPARPRRRAR